MKNFFKLVLLVVIALFSVSIQAQEIQAPLKNSLLWEISGNGLANKSYLYGTVHVICASDFFLTEKVKKALENSNKLILEINMADPNEIASMQDLAMGKLTLDKTLNSSQLSKLDEILKKNTGMTVQQVNGYRLTTVMSLISIKSFNCNELKFYEMEFIAKAKERKMEVSGLETVKNQFSIIENAYTTDEMIASLAESNSELNKALVNEYKNENIETLYKNSTTEKLMSVKTRAEMLDNRNINWVKALPEMLLNESSFIAVGAAHLAGEFGVINLLRKAGYSVNPVMK
ncbi:hypothetical protein SAMN05444396_102374 [Flavobacterium segetis]|uniref:TraB family protein n=1 Tax=Flavobacterium segetis TaxID=271157 RepID=A0A1M5FGI0_9FLAO|nr:TraB/GumN family protein [Flavobacterium segetis]SHF90588.1 hypothetical protein SAMN05444396_102374 [Flavobacterium segetis]